MHSKNKGDGTLQTTSYLLIIVFALTNLAAFVAYGVDKRKAVKGAWRIPEATLLLLAALGPLGAFLGMELFRHKTRKPKFRYGVPALLLLHLFLFGLVFFFAG